jgi:DNA-binding XRE family transcriptional regulator
MTERDFPWDVALPMSRLKIDVCATNGRADHRKEGRPEWAVIPYEEYRALLERAEATEDRASYDRALAAVAAGEEWVPAPVVDALLARENPIRVWREYRGLPQDTLAGRVGIAKAYLSQLESGKHAGSARVLRRLAVALGVEMED